MSEQLSSDFTSGNVSKQMINFALPLFLSNLLQAVYNMVDMVVVGQFVGKTGLSAVSIGGDVLNMLTFLVMGFSNAGQVIISQNLGAGEKSKIGKVIGNMFSLLLLTAVGLSVLCLFFRNVILGWMNTPAEVWDYTLSYVTTCAIGLIFIYGYNVVSAVLRGMGDSKHPFIFIATAAVINLILDLLFVIVFKMAVFGAALATVIGQGVSFIWGAVFLFKNQKRFGIELNRECFKMEKDNLLVLVKLGLPMAIKFAAVTFSKLFVDSWINAYGVIASSASGIEHKLGMISNLFSSAINVAGSAMIGQNIGAQKYDRVPKVLKTSYIINLTIFAVLSLCMILFPGFIFGIFTSDKDVLSASLQMVSLMVLMFLGSAVRSPNNGLIDGTGNYKLNFATALFDGIINRIGFALLFGVGMNMGWIGFLYGDAVAGFTPLVIGGIYYLSGKWKTRKYLLG
jgi:putative MATE family efflux protein